MPKPKKQPKRRKVRACRECVRLGRELAECQIVAERRLQRNKDLVQSHQKHHDWLEDEVARLASTDKTLQELRLLLLGIER